jgi:hypothetical protein
MEDKGKLAGCRKIGCRVVIAVIVILMIVGISMGIKYGCERSSAMKPFETHLNEYTSIAGLKEASPQEGQYIRGKVVSVDLTENKIDPLFLDLPPELIAKTPEEVETIIWLKWKDVAVGHYTDGATGYRIDCELTIIDKVELKIVDVKTYYGSDPPSAKSGSGDRYGSKPTYDIVNYLKALPRR